MASVLLGALGGGYCIYGKRRGNWVALVAGVALCVFPYFVDSSLVIWIIGGLVAVVPFVVRP